MKKYGLPEDEILKKQLAQIDRNFKRSVVLLVVCAIIIMLVIVKCFPFE